MNKVFLIGNVCSGVDDKTSDGGTPHARFRIAVQRKFKDKDGKYQSDFFSVDAWRHTAEFATKYISKGDKVGIIGSLQTREWQTQGGEKRYATDIVAEEVEKLSRNENRDIVPPGFTEVENPDEIDSLPF